jgi:hypothetical protein
MDRDSPGCCLIGEVSETLAVNEKLREKPVEGDRKAMIEMAEMNVTRLVYGNEMNSSEEVSPPDGDEKTSDTNETESHKDQGCD